MSNESSLTPWSRQLESYHAGDPAPGGPSCLERTPRSGPRIPPLALDPARPCVSEEATARGQEAAGAPEAAGEPQPFPSVALGEAPEPCSVATGRRPSTGGVIGPGGRRAAAQADGVSQGPVDDEPRRPVVECDDGKSLHRGAFTGSSDEPSTRTPLAATRRGGSPRRVAGTPRYGVGSTLRRGSNGRWAGSTRTRWPRGAAPRHRP